MHSTLNFLVLLHLTQLCLSAPGWFDGLDLFASNTLPQPGAPDDDLLSYASLDDNSNVNLEPLDGLNLGESSADLDMFQSSDESISGQETVAGEQDQCSFNNLQPASRVRARGTSCDDVKQSPALNLPTLNNLPKPASMNPPDWMPLEDSKLLNIPEIEDRESCPMSPRGWYYIPICGNQLGEHGWYKPTAVNPLRGWTVTEASIWKIGFDMCFSPKKIFCCEMYYSNTEMAYPCETVHDAWTWADMYESVPSGGGFHGGAVPSGAE